jgi:uncharacterized OB-fold protein
MRRRFAKSFTTTRAGCTTLTERTRSSGELGRRERPPINYDNEFFWDGIQEGTLRIQRCSDCGRFRYPAIPSCSRCHSLTWETIESDGRGAIYSYVTVHHPPTPGFALPYVVVLVELDEGVRLPISSSTMTPEELTIGARVEIGFTRDGDFVFPDVHLASSAKRGEK